MTVSATETALWLSWAIFALRAHFGEQNRVTLDTFRPLRQVGIRPPHERQTRLGAGASIRPRPLSPDCFPARCSGVRSQSSSSAAQSYRNPFGSRRKRRDGRNRRFRAATRSARRQDCRTRAEAADPGQPPARHDRHARILFLSMHSDPLVVARALQAGAAAYVLKDSSPADFIRAFEKVRARGNSSPSR